MEIPKNLKYAKSHEWVSFDGNIATIGITDFAQDALTDIVFVTLPNVDDTLEIGSPFCEIESVKSVSEVFSPVSGKIIAINEELLNAPELINEKPYDSWLIKVEFNEIENLIDASSYEAFCQSES
jgi:glycine cleavage system H protein